MEDIQASLLQKLQQTFQKDVDDLIDIYIKDTKKKLKTLIKNLEDQNLQNFMAILKELRHRSVEVGAIQFSHYCLMLEIAAQEMHFKKLNLLIASLEKVFMRVQDDLELYRENGI